jgi:DNA polymerase (family X)
MQVDLRIIDESAFGAALLYFTGSKQHNIALRERAIKKKMRLNEYGLFKEDEAPATLGDDETGSGATDEAGAAGRAKSAAGRAGGTAMAPQKRGIKPIAAKTEEEIYKKLGLPWIPPELREDRGEFEDEGAHLPELITLEDIKAELHAHTIASDGRFTIDELAIEAKERGFHTIAVTDHSKSSVLANGLSSDRLLRHIDAVHAANDRVKGITILAGAEVDILVDGRLDYDDDLLAKLDIVVASPHASLKQDSQTATKRLLSAIRHPLVHIIGHPTGRYINKREGLTLDLPAVIDAAVKHNTALEINSNHMRLDLRDTHVRAVVEAGGVIAVNTDAHSADDFDELRYGVVTARRGWLTAKQCINAWPKAKLHKWLKAKR